MGHPTACVSLSLCVYIASAGLTESSHHICFVCCGQGLYSQTPNVTRHHIISTRVMFKHDDDDCGVIFEEQDIYN